MKKPSFNLAFPPRWRVKYEKSGKSTKSGNIDRCWTYLMVSGELESVSGLALKGWLEMQSYWHWINCYVVLDDLSLLFFIVFTCAAWLVRLYILFGPNTPPLGTPDLQLRVCQDLEMRAGFFHGLFPRKLLYISINKYCIYWEYFALLICQMFRFEECCQRNNISV